MWIHTGSYGWFRGEWVNKYFLRPEEGIIIKMHNRATISDEMSLQCNLHSYVY